MSCLNLPRNCRIAHWLGWGIKRVWLILLDYIHNPVAAPSIGKDLLSPCTKHKYDKSTDKDLKRGR
jgi:hypothetical protein